jgi:hypothetical protein
MSENKNPNCEYPYCYKIAEWEMTVSNSLEEITYYYCTEHVFKYSLGHLIIDKIKIDDIVITKIF